MLRKIGLLFTYLAAKDVKKYLKIIRPMGDTKESVPKNKFDYDFNIG